MTVIPTLLSRALHPREETGENEIDMHKVADYAIKKGWTLPKPVDPKELLAKQFADAARHETRRDIISNKPYRAYHAVPSEKKRRAIVILG